MISLPNFPHRVRIHGGGFDASARAMHRKAAIEMVSIATIERIQMSTKTTLKRVSLVAVAALGFGLLSVVPSSATPQSDTLSISATSSNGYDLTAAPKTITTRLLLTASKTQILAQAIQVKESGTGGSAS